MSDNDSEEEVCDLSNPQVTTKYTTVSGICNQALALVCESCVPDADIAELCSVGDAFMEAELAKHFTKKDSKGRKVDKGVAYPTCICVNDIVCHFSPMRGASSRLVAGDLAKVDLACHIDGYIAQAAHTVIVGAEEVYEKKADVMHAAWNAAEAALRLVKVGNTNTQVTEMFGQVASEFGCQPLHGVLSHEMKKHVIDGSRVIIGVETLEEKVDEFEFGMNEVYCLDIVMSTGEGKAKEAPVKHTVYKKILDASYQLKTQKARKFISEVGSRFPTTPFTLRAIEDESVARIGISEAKRNQLVHEYPVMKERPGEFVAQFKFTVLLLPGGTKKVTGLPGEVVMNQAKTLHAIEDEDLRKLLATSVATSRKPKKKRKEAQVEAEKEEGNKDE